MIVRPRRPPRRRPPSRTLPRRAASSAARRAAPSRRVAKLYVVPNCELEPPPPLPSRRRRTSAWRARACSGPRSSGAQQGKARARAFDESEVEMAAAMFDSRPIEIARPLLFESEEDEERRRAERRAEAQAQVAQKKRKRGER
ncbi:hypothetical protein JL722_12839 [Aureococcus anophagefferens]|nr:hypothetical protein JL722_12839 [Aureococcus anophagefferens]